MAIILPRTFMAASYDFLEARVAQSIITRFITADDNLVTYAGTAWAEQKELRFVRNTSEMESNTLIVKAEAMASVGTTNIGFFINSESNPRKVLSTVGTAFTLLEGTCYIGDLLNGINSIKINLQNLEYGTSYQQLIEIWEKR
ncbi:MAG TPA: hypothetical protein VJ438_03260 [Candidatus Nanoarchaeia archaeon]|nr:hypothetical protein [Candidatus Nanoarchaeia archaeon]